MTYKKHLLTVSLGPLLILLALTGLLGCPSPSTISLFYIDILVEHGGGKQIAPIWTGEEPEVTYSITPEKEGITIDEDTGVLSVGSEAPVASSGTYTVTVTAASSYIESTTASLAITILRTAVERLEYEPITATYSDGGTSTPVWGSNEKPEADGVTYTIAPKNDHIRIDENTGVVTVAPKTPEASSGEYTVTATATATGNHKGHTSSGLTITIRAHVHLTYQDITIAYGSDDTTSTAVWVGKEPIADGSDDTTSTAVWTGEEPKVTYTITPEKDHITVDENTGVLTVAQGTPVASSGIYTVTARAKDGNYFIGPKTRDLLILINPIDPAAESLSYKDTDVPYSEGITIRPTTTLPDGATYTIERWQHMDKNGTGVSINDGTGEILVAKETPVASSGEYLVTVTGSNLSRKAYDRLTIKIIPRGITGKLSYLSTTILVANDATTLNPVTIKSEWSNRDYDDQDVTYTLRYRYNHDKKIPGPEVKTFGINKETGDITIQKNLPRFDTSEYIVTANGKGNYAGSITANVDIITPKALITQGTLTYPNATVQKGDGGSINPVWSNRENPPQGVRYSGYFSPKNVNEKYIVVDSDTGVVTIKKDIPQLEREYTVVVQTSGSKDYEGWTEAKFTITVK